MLGSRVRCHADGTEVHISMYWPKIGDVAEPTSRRDVRKEPDSDLSRAEFAYRRIRGAIQSGEFQPGQRMREVKLAEHFEVSRTPIRDAIRRLTADGLIENVTGRGLAVSQFNMQQVRELYYLRACLEGAAAAAAAQHPSLSDLRSMADLLNMSGRSLGNPQETARLNRIFHQVIYDAAHNRYLLQALSQMSDTLALLPGTTFEAPGRAAAALAEHRELLAAIAEQSPQRAEQAARDHIRMASETRISMMFRIG